MGYSASVMCNCYKEGKTSEPPYKDFMKIDEEGMYLDLEALYKQDKAEYNKRHDAFDEWKRTACPHEDMELVYERLANISGMMAFKTVIREFGGKIRFPVLTQYLPVGNVGILPADFAGKALLELQDLEQKENGEDKVILKIKGTGEKKQATNVNHPTLFIWTAYNKLNYGLDDDGFFIIENEIHSEEERSTLVFRSKDFKQIFKSKDAYCFKDNQTNLQFIGTAKLYPAGKEEPTEDVDFQVVKKKIPLAIEYSYIIEPLKKLLAASLETGNHVMWR